MPNPDYKLSNIWGSVHLRIGLLYLIAVYEDKYRTFVCFCQQILRTNVRYIIPDLEMNIKKKNYLCIYTVHW